MTTTSLADAKNRLSEIIAAVEKTHERTVVTKNGRPVAAIMSIEDLDSLEETLEIMSDPELMAKIRTGREAAARGEFASDEEMRETFRRLNVPLPAALA